MTFGRSWLVFAVGLAACTVDLAPPEPTSVEPVRGYNLEATDITVVGQRFYPQIEVDATGGDHTQVNAGFAVRLERDGATANLDEVSLEDYEHLHATVPAGLELGTWDVVVVGPSGQEGRLPDGFTVTDTRADRIDVDSASVVYQVFEFATLEIALVDPEAQPVLEDLEVAVVVKNDDGPIAAQFQPDGLEDQQPFVTGFGILGHLGDDGRASVGFTVGSPETVDVLVTGPDGAQVEEGTIKIRFDTGSDLAVALTLPSDPLVVTAGAPFDVGLTLVDQFGFPVEGADELVVLKDQCDSFVDAVSVHETAVVQVALTEATGTTGCPTDRLLTIAGPPVFGAGAASPEIGVLPDVVHGFDVQTSPSILTAGEPDLDVVVTPVDEFGNRADWTPSTLTLTDSVGGVGGAECGTGIPVFCTVLPVVAAPAVRLRVEDEAGIFGLSSLYLVRPGAPESLEVTTAAGPAVAGQPLAVEARARDAWDNVVPNALLPESVLWTSDGDAPDCVAGAADANGTLHFGCSLFVARPDAVLDAEVLLPALTGASAPFAVVNGPLGEVQVDPSDTTVVAGVPLDLSFAAFDAFGNPWIVQDSPIVGVADTGGSLSLTQVTLDAAGHAQSAGTFTLEGSTEVVALRGNQEVGRSEPVQVQAAGAAAIAVDAGAPWVWVGDDVPVAVAVVDAFGNSADWSGTVTLAAASGHAAPSPVPITDGTGTGVLVWTDPDLSETILATAPVDLGGTSPPFAVVEDCVTGGPTAHVSFGGFDDAVVCLDGSGEGLLAASLSLSTAGTGGALAFDGVRAGDVWTTSTNDPTLDLTLPGAGHYDVEALVAGTDGCGDSAFADAWAGPDDGSAVGPIAVTPFVTTLNVGQDTTDVDLAATDCSRDDAAGATVRVRSDRGVLADVSATGSGLGVTLDGGGAATVTLDARPADSGGPSEVVAWSPAGAAFGEAAVTFVGDSRRPTVWDLEPSGDTTGTIDTVVLVFSEPLFATSVTPAAFTVTGPSPTTVVSAVRDPGGAIVTLTLSPAVDAGAGTWTVTATLDVRDLAGNRLDGADTGVASDFTGRFGDVSPAADPVSGCAPTPTTFRPDGDDGAGIESDEVAFALDSNTAPFRWVATVHGSGDVVLRRDRLVPAGATDTWVWDGRDAGGRVLPDAAYVVTIEGEDSNGNHGGACTAVVTIQQHAGGAP